MYRYPKDDLKTNLAFYQRGYRQGMTTEMPEAAELARLLATNFRGTEKDLSVNVRIVKGQKECGRLLDYGCSWGYGVYQFLRAGYDAMGFEISRSRADYGRRHLGVAIVDSPPALGQIEPHSFDVIHASHVLEHLPELQGPFATFQVLLKPSGVLLVFVPNAGGKNARELGVRWGPMICEKHCLALDASFFAQNLSRYGLHPVFGSSPYRSALRPYEVIDGTSDALAGDELLVVARPVAARTSDA